MPVEILMPALSPTMEEGKLAKWVVQPGDHIKTGDVIAEIETDKALVELEAATDGVVGKLLIQSDQAAIKVGVPIGLILTDGEDKKVLDDYTPASSVSSQPPEPSQQVAHPPEPAKELGEQKPTQQPTQPPARKVPSANISPDLKPPRSSTFPKGTKTKPLTVRAALCDAMAEEMKRDKNVFVMGEEVGEYQGAYKVTQGLLERFGPQRVVDTPITEHGMAGLGVGAAFSGLRPVVEFMTFNFAMQAMDQIVNSAAKTHYMSGGTMRCPIVFRGPNGAAKGVAAQHSQDYAAWYSSVPGLKVIAPYSASDAKGLLKAAIRDENPVIFLEHELLYGKTHPVPELKDFTLPIGQAHILHEGKDATLVGFSRGVELMLQAHERLQADNISCDVIDLRTLRPMDREAIIWSVRRTNRLVVVEEGWPFAGVGAEIAALVQEMLFDHLDAPIIRVSGQDVPLPYAENLETLALPRVEQIIQSVRQVCYK